MYTVYISIYHSILTCAHIKAEERTSTWIPFRLVLYFLFIYLKISFWSYKQWVMTTNAGPSFQVENAQVTNDLDCMHVRR